MVKVKLLSDYNGYLPNTVIEVSQQDAEYLCGNLLAVRVWNTATAVNTLPPTEHRSVLEPFTRRGRRPVETK